MGQIPPNLRPLRVLVVEDYADARESLCLLIRLWGHVCATAASGPAALEVATAFRPDAVLMDICLPGVDGYEVARALRKLAGLSGAVIVAMTGYGRTDDEQRSRDAGFVSHLLKPVDLAELEEMLAHFVAGCADPSAWAGEPVAAYTE